MSCKDRLHATLEILLAIELLEYHDRNYLSMQMSMPDSCNREKRRLLEDCIALRRSEITPIKKVTNLDRKTDKPASEDR